MKEEDLQAATGRECSISGKTVWIELTKILRSTKNQEYKILWEDHVSCLSIKKKNKLR